MTKKDWKSVFTTDMESELNIKEKHSFIEHVFLKSQKHNSIIIYK